MATRQCRYSAAPIVSADAVIHVAASPLFYHPSNKAGLYVGWPDSLPQPDVPAIPGINEGTLERFDYQNHTAMRRATLLRTHEVGLQMRLRD